MEINFEDIKNQILSLVKNQRKAKINWIVSIVQRTEKEVLEIANELNLEIDGEYILYPFEELPEVEKNKLTKDEYDKLYPRPDPTFCETRGSKR